MNDQPKQQRSFRRRRYWLSLSLGLVTLLLGALAYRSETESPVEAIRLTAGPAGTTRELLAQSLARETGARGLRAELIPAGSTTDVLQRVNEGAIDFALVSGALRAEQYIHLRLVAPLFVETLHLLIKREFAAKVDHDLAGLRGLGIELGLPGSATEALGSAILALAGIPPAEAPGQPGYYRLTLDTSQRARIFTESRRDQLPDALFVLAMLPSKLAMHLIRDADYRLVAIPFADAFRMSAVITEGPEPVTGEVVERLFTTDTVIPAYTYRIEPPVPAEAIHSVGVPLLLVTHDGVADETVGRVLDAVFNSRFAQMSHPPLQRSALDLPTRIPLHSGSAAFRDRDQTLLTSDQVDTLSNMLSVIGAVIGTALFLRQAWHQKRQAQRDELFGSYLIRVARVERTLAELELSSSLELETLVELQRELLRLKSEALEHFASGALGSQSTLVDLLTPINSAREQLGQLLLHVRETLEAQADDGGCRTDELWPEPAELAPSNLEPR